MVFDYWMIIHIAKFITFISLAIKDVLFLRIVVTFAIIIEVFYQLQIANKPDIAFWNCLFLMINSIQVVKLIRERSPIKIPDYLIFPNLILQKNYSQVRGRAPFPRDLILIDIFLFRFRVFLS